MNKQNCNSCGRILPDIQRVVIIEWRCACGTLYKKSEDLEDLIWFQENEQILSTR